MHNARDLPASLDLLRGFEAAARHLSFTTAARELFVTQSAVSRQVQQLEDQLGVKLFHRRTRALALTEPGERYFVEVSRALQQLRDATSALRAKTNPVVTVTTSVTFASLWLVPRLARFQAQHEDVTVHIAADNAMRDLDRGDLDVAVRYSSAKAAGPDAVMLFGERVAPVCSSTFLKRHAKPRTPDDLLRLPLLHFEDQEHRTPWLSWNVWFEAMGVAAAKVPRGSLFSHYDQMLQAAAAGQGVALGRFPIAERFLKERRLVVPLSGERFSRIAQDRAYWLIVSQAAAARAEVKTFVKWLRGEVER